MVKPQYQVSKRKSTMTSSAGDGTNLQNETQIPDYGLKLKLNHVYPENRSQNYIPTFKQIWAILPLILRYILYYIKSMIFGRSVVMDYIEVQRSKRIYGVPIGGIGCGSIGRGYRGEFCRFQLIPGMYEYNTVDANQFIVTIKDQEKKTIFQSLLSTFPKKKLSSWRSFIDGDACNYTGLYPRSWTEYDLSDYGVMVTCRQVSPIIPNNYKDSSLPCVVFVWDVKNICEEERTVTIAFTFKNGTGDTNRDRKSTCSSKEFSYLGSEGVILYHTINKMPCAYAISARSKPEISISKCLYFDPNSNGSKLWDQLKNAGNFEKVPDKNYGQVFGEMGCGVATKATIQPKNSVESEMSLMWDMPTVTFPKSLKKYNRFYTKYFGAENAALKIVDYAFKNYPSWEEAIYKWQIEVFNDGEIPDWYKGALFNQTYYVSDGGTIWTVLDPEEADALPEHDPRREVGRFAFLEGHEYRMYNTYDVQFYASFALIMNWPKLQFSLQYDMRDAIFVRIPDKVEMLYDGKMVERKQKNTVPHDIGDPGEAPFSLINAYPIHDVSEWRDLNPKFVLQIYRDAITYNEPDFSLTYIHDMYEACNVIMNKTLEFDVDGDGLIENSGAPDQTFDTWVMCGSSAYCGGLWLSALLIMTSFAEILDKQEDKEKFQDLLDKGKIAYEKKLWNGKYYNFDCSKDECRSIMADQLCGEWYLRTCGIQNEVLPPENVVSTLKTIYENNVLGFCNGEMGAVNGFIDGKVDRYTIQSEEVWTGVTYVLAAHMILADMWQEAFHTAGGMYNSMTEKMGLAFEAPEALYATKYYRSIGYMRPLSIWAMQLALNVFRGK